MDCPTRISVGCKTKRNVVLLSRWTGTMRRVRSVQEKSGGVMWTVTKEFSFEAAHSLPHLPATHKCHRLHGHSYRVVIVCRGDLQPDYSWVVDYAEISDVMVPIVLQLDHQNLNDILGIHTTAENLAYWIYRKLMAALPTLYAVHVMETANTNVIYCPRP